MFDTTTGVVLTAVLSSWRAALTRDAVGSSPAQRVDRIRALEELRSAVAAAQAVETAAFLAERREHAEATAVTRITEDGRRPLSRKRQLRQAERCAQGEVALARRMSPAQGQKFSGFAMILTTELPQTFAALQAGRVSEWRAQIVATETIWLSAKHRAEVDAEIAAELDKHGDKRLQAALRAMAYRLDPQGFTDRARRAESDRRVSVRPAPDAMAYLTALLPLTDAVAVNKALLQVADRARAQGDERSRGQVQADTLVDLLLGRTSAGDLGIAVEIELLLTADTLTGTGPDAHEPGWLDGHPIPAPIARDLALATNDDEIDNDEANDNDNDNDDDGVALTADGVTKGGVTKGGGRSVRRSIRRLFADPDTGDLAAMDSTARRFTPAERRFLRLRDHSTCRTPWCNAPLRHTDHIVPAETGGPTSITNGQGLCEHCNYLKQAPGWTARPDGHGPAPDIVLTSATGHTYRSQAPPGPGQRRPTTPAETQHDRTLIDNHHAA
jgi:hypothetical protein